MMHNRKNRAGATEIVMILDRSGSMAPMIDDAIGGFNAMLEEQKRLPGEARLSCVLFNQAVLPLYDRLPLEAVPPLTRAQYRPGGSTALLEAIGTAIERTVMVQKALPPQLRAGRVLFAITTDGLENASRRFDRATVRRMIELEQRRYGWEFLFLGANIDAVETAAEFGIRASNAANFRADGEGARANYRSVNRAITQVRCSDAPLTGSWREDVDADFRRPR